MLAFITALLPLVADLGPVVAHLIATLRNQGTDSETILAHAEATLDAEGVALVKEKLRLEDEINQGVK